jgi:hypothetical protein
MTKRVEVHILRSIERYIYFQKILLCLIRKWDALYKILVIGYSCYPWKESGILKNEKFIYVWVLDQTLYLIRITQSPDYPF